MLLKKSLCLLVLVLGISAHAQEPVKTPGIFFDVNVGAATRLGKKDPNPSTRNYSEQLRSSLSFDVSLYFRAKADQNHFVGFKYNTFRKEAGINGSYTPGVQNYSMSDKINLDFYGVGYLYNNLEPDGKSEWNLETALGYMTFRDQAKVGQEHFDITGNTVGLYLGGSYHIKVYRSLFIGPKLAFLVGGVKNLEVSGNTNGNTIDPNYTESLTRADVSASIRLKF